MQSNHSNECSHGDRANRTTGFPEMLVEDLNISEATARRLSRSGIATLGQLQSLCTDDLYRIYWIGKGSVQEIQNALRELGYEPLGAHAPRQTVRRIT